jgi:hypothetical protein
VNAKDQDTSSVLDMFGTDGRGAIERAIREQRDSLPALEGTPEEAEEAGRIRLGMIPEIATVAWRWDAELNTRLAYQCAGPRPLDRVVDGIRGRTSAAWWVARRGQDAGAILRSELESSDPGFADYVSEALKRTRD